MNNKIFICIEDFKSTCEKSTNKHIDKNNRECKIGDLLVVDVDVMLTANDIIYQNKKEVYYFKMSVLEKHFIELSKYRELRINEILE